MFTLAVTWTEYDFLIFKAGLSQALIGFEGDVLVMNPDFEKEDIPPALEQLRLDLAVRLPISPSASVFQRDGVGAFKGGANPTINTRRKKVRICPPRK